MTEARPLREVFADLAGNQSADPGELLAAHGHADLPEELVAEAVVSYADTAPAEVAEHLAPYVMSHSAVPTEEPTDTPWFELLGTAPEPTLSDLDSPQETVELDEDPGPGLDFGAGATQDTVGVVVTDLPAEPVTEHHAAPAEDLGWEPTGAAPLGEQPIDLPDHDVDDDLFD